MNNESFHLAFIIKGPVKYRYFLRSRNRAHIKMNTTIKNVSLVIYRDE